MKIKSVLAQGLIIIGSIVLGIWATTTIQVLFLTPKIIVSTYSNVPYFNPSGIPNLIQVNGQWWYIIEGTIKNDDLAEKGADGYTDCSNNVIWLRSQVPLVKKRSDIVHELLHAGACGKPDDWWNNKAANGATQDGHLGIYRTSIFITEVLHENPELTKFIAGN